MNGCGYNVDVWLSSGGILFVMKGAWLVLYESSTNLRTRDTAEHETQRPQTLWRIAPRTCVLRAKETQGDFYGNLCRLPIFSAS